ncbi:TLR2 [Branchiostoma lanceolatum]|uniref:TLR2 protein n=1 Tax=Branchiostoma lanceolatum TaxID=7740 RepID=A0A8J9VHW2_BRALA|nr:TLR2 [Branchiostoma lanceolatum]
MSDIVGQDGDISHDLESVPDNTQPQASVSGQSRIREELEFHSPTESQDDTDGREAVGVAPPLGQHEKYHVFFCYSIADAPWVKDMVQKLESDELGFSCCFHERDFTPGIPIIENIVRSVKASRKTVFVLSREFVASRWCTYEMQMVMRRHLSEGEKIVIPVMLRECDLPEFIQHMTYLEESTPYFSDKFIGALKESLSADPSTHSDSFSTFTYNSNFTNGELVLRIESVCDTYPPCARFHDQIFPSELATRGIRVPRNDYFAVLNKLMGTAPLKYFNCFFNAAEGVSSSVVSVDMDAETPLLSEGSGDEDSYPQTSRMSELKTEAEALLLKYSDQYVRLLVSRKLPQPRQSRGHTQQGACLCQLVELREFGWKLDREETSAQGSGDPSVV